MGDHTVPRFKPLGDAYRELHALRAPVVMIADSRVIRSEGLILKRLARGHTVFVQRDPAKPGIAKRIATSIGRAVKLGLGKVRRLA